MRQTETPTLGAASGINGRAQRFSRLAALVVATALAVPAFFLLTLVERLTQ